MAPSPDIQISILLADDHTLFRDALLTYINRAEPSAHVVAVQDLHQARDQLAMQSFDLVLLDWRMPGVAQMEDLIKIAQEYPKSAFALMSGVIEEQDVRKVLDAGFRGYFPKTLSGRAMIDGMRKILKGERFIPHAPGSSALQPSYVADPMFYQPDSSERTAGPAPDLTVRERDVLERLVRGKTNAEIAEALGIKLVTVKLHLRNACQKLGARNRTDAALKCRALGLFK